jgi:2-polyprenyl-3-methyl-5-hydroxy-6-metoxy-1,4-benzoquinol methylase
MNTATVPIERVIECPVCGCRRNHRVCKARDQQHGLSRQTFVYAKCHDCRVVFQSVRPTEDAVATFYPSDYKPFQANPQTAVGPGTSALPLVAIGQLLLRVSRRLNAAVLRRYPDPLPAAIDAVYTWKKPGQVLLDFGCGSEAFLDQARQRGWTTFGADFVPSVVEAVRRAGHRAILVEPGFWDGIPDQSVDVVRMNHVVEHLYDPHVVMTQLRRIMRPGGRLHAATPNGKSATFRLLRQNWFPLECPRHIVLYSPKSLRRLCLQAGFDGVTSYNEVLTKDTARSLGYFLRRYGMIGEDAALEMMNRPVLSSMLFSPARIAALCGRADRFHIIARVD